MALAGSVKTLMAVRSRLFALSRLLNRQRHVGETGTVICGATALCYVQLHRKIRSRDGNHERAGMKPIYEAGTTAVLAAAPKEQSPRSRGGLSR